MMSLGKVRPSLFVFTRAIRRPYKVNKPPLLCLQVMAAKPINSVGVAWNHMTEQARACVELFVIVPLNCGPISWLVIITICALVLLATAPIVWCSITWFNIVIHSLTLLLMFYGIHVLTSLSPHTLVLFDNIALSFLPCLAHFPSSVLELSEDEVKDWVGPPDLMIGKTVFINSRKFFV